MVRRILLTLCIAALGVTAWWITHRGQAPDEGLVVHVVVVDEDGQPLPGAQAQATYAPGWHTVDAAGRLRLTNVLLRAEEEPSPEALRAAVHVRARFYTQRRGSLPEATAREDGSWSLRFSLQHHGVFRLEVAQTHLGQVKAFLEPSVHWEAMDRGNVARPDAPAAYRIYPGLERLVVRVIGEPDKDGVVKAATRRIVFPAPAPGFLVEHRVRAGEVKPILGTVLPPNGGPPPPSLVGTVTITGIEADGTRLAYGTVPVDHSGTFVVRTLGAGDYELEAACAYLGEIPPALVEGGGSVTLRAERPIPWVTVLHPEVPDAQDQGLQFRFLKDDGAVPPETILYGKGRTTLPLPGFLPDEDMVWALQIRAPGSEHDAPRLQVATLSVTSDDRQVEVPLALEASPSGTVIVRVSRALLTERGGATVRVGGRPETTLIAKLAESATFQNVRAGQEVEVVVEWNRGAPEPTRRTVTVQANATTTVEVPNGS